MISFNPNIKNIGVSGAIAKAAGVAGIGIIGYDAHHAAVEEAREVEKGEKADTLALHFMEDMKADSPSVVKAAIKKHVFLCHLDENFTDFFANIKGYCAGFTKMVTSNTIPLALSAGALFIKNKALSKASAIGLAAYSSIFLLQTAFGIGKSKE